MTGYEILQGILTTFYEDTRAIEASGITAFAGEPPNFARARIALQEWAEDPEPELRERAERAERERDIALRQLGFGSYEEAQDWLRRRLARS